MIINSYFYKFRKTLKSIALLMMALILSFPQFKVIADDDTAQQKFLTKVPNLIGMAGDEITGTLNKSHLRLGVISSRESLGRIDSVIEQLPKRGTTVLFGTYVGVVVSSGVKMPNVKGQTKMDAISQLTGTGLPESNIGTTETVSYCGAGGVVVAQSPFPDFAVDKKSIINLTISSISSGDRPRLPFKCNTGCCLDICTGRGYEAKTGRSCELP